MDELTTRQSSILEAVIESFVSTGRPVGSKFLSQEGDFGVAPSTMRNELSRLEQLGYLDHPHTSAGRVPTDKGYRFYVDLTARRRRTPALRATGAELPVGELEDALRCAAEFLARDTGLLAMITAPSQANSAIRHVEVLKLNPDLVMVVVVTASGGIAKKLIVFDEPVDSGLVDWSRAFLNDAICGLDLGSRMLMHRLIEPELSEAERMFIEALAPAFSRQLAGEGAQLYLEGASRFLTRLQEDGSDHVHHLMRMLDSQQEIAGILEEALGESNLFLRIGRELSRSAMSDCSLVATCYGVAHRNLGTVGVLGPMRMDYPSVIFSVRHTAWSLSRFVEEIYQ